MQRISVTNCTPVRSASIVIAMTAAWALDAMSSLGSTWYLAPVLCEPIYLHALSSKMAGEEIKFRRSINTILARLVSRKF